MPTSCSNVEPLRGLNPDAVVEIMLRAKDGSFLMGEIGVKNSARFARGLPTFLGFGYFCGIREISLDF